METEGRVEPESMRCSDADRDRVAGVLREAAAEGRITLQELEERLEVTYEARTYADLRPVTADLPDAAAPVSASVAATEPRHPDTDQVMRMSASMGNISRRGTWRVPARLEVRNPWGNTRLDFRGAVFQARVVDLEIDASWGHAHVILPLGATAEIDVRSSWGGTVSSRVPEMPSRDRPHLRISGNAKGGRLSVRERKPRGSWWGEDEDWSWDW